VATQPPATIKLRGVGAFSTRLYTSTKTKKKGKITMLVKVRATHIIYEQRREFHPSCWLNRNSHQWKKFTEGPGLALKEPLQKEKGSGLNYHMDIYRPRHSWYKNGKPCPEGCRLLVRDGCWLGIISTSKKPAVEAGEHNVEITAELKSPLNRISIRTPLTYLQKCLLHINKHVLKNLPILREGNYED